MTKKEEYEAYIAKVRARGVAITEYSCPNCGEEIMTRAAAPGETWDTLSSCPHCDELHMKYTIGDFATATPFNI
jgi:predicted RNA-binding Zn-ribbon protein involved in translation (DUF1610 family)